MGDNNIHKQTDIIVSILVGLLLSLILGLVLYLLTTLRCVAEKLGLISYVVIFLSVVIPAFIINLILPVSINRRRAIIVSIPTLIILFIFFSIKPYYEYHYVTDMQKDIWYLIRISCFIGPIISFGISAFTAFAGWLGSWIYFRIKQMAQGNI